MKGSGGALKQLLSVSLALTPSQNLFELLANKGADMNHRYPEEAWDEKDYKCSVMINLVRHNLLEMKEMRSNL